MSRYYLEEEALTGKEMATRSMLRFQAVVERNYETPSDDANAVLVVQGKRLHVTKELLMIGSPVFKAMFTGNFKEAKTKEVQLKGKKVEHIVWMLDYLYPETNFTLTESMATALVPIADEYQLKRLTLRCTDILMNMEHTKLRIVVLAQRYGLGNLERKAIKDCALNVPCGHNWHCSAKSSLEAQEKLPENMHLTKDALITIYKTKIAHVKRIVEDIQRQLSPLLTNERGDSMELKRIRSKVDQIVVTGAVLNIC